MIVCLSGAHSTGKSTLIEQFRDIEGFVCIDSVTRSTISLEERRIDRGVTEEGQLRIADAIVAKTQELLEMEEKDPAKIYLLDRSVFDFLAYSHVFADRKQISDHCYSELVKKVEDCMKAYDLVIRIPIRFEIVDDGSRSVDTSLQREVDNYLLRLLDGTFPGCSYTVEYLYELSVDERVSRINKVISEVRSRKDSGRIFEGTH